MDIQPMVGGFSVGLAVWLFTVGIQASWRSFKQIAN